MSVTLMAASCDSIGSCSLDVDAESLAESSQVDPSSANHRTSDDLDPNAASLSEKTLHSLLLSTSAKSNGLDLPSTALPGAAKKPSYLNLACSISGYGGITTYDSKLREGFRSRDHSPGKLAGISREASPARGLGLCRSNCGNFLTAPNASRIAWTPSPVDMKHVSPNGTIGTDHTDATGNISVKKLTEQRNKWLESTLSPSGKSNEFQNVVSVFETRSNGRRGLKTETTLKTRYELNTSSHSTVVSSTTVISNSNPSYFSNNNVKTERIIPVTIEKGSSNPKSYHHKAEDSSSKIVSNGSSMHHTPPSTKSFIQQRVERLYGPCALAQGFFHRSCKNPSFSPLTSSGTNGFASEAAQDEHNGKSLEQCSNSPELPVLRHLRPEFRDQLPVAPRRSLGSRISNDLVAPKSSVLVKQTQLHHAPQQLQHQTSTESIADLQPAAPEVVLPQPSSSLTFKNKSDLTSTALVKEALVEQQSLSDKSSSEEKKAESNINIAPGNEENVGHEFLRIQRQTIEKLLKLAEGAETEIENSGKNGNTTLSEEALGHLRAAAGQARLLVTQKMVQFEGLCRKCISQSPNEPFPTTAEDLQGFWDMLLLQVEQVNNTFLRLDKLRAVGWCEEKLSAGGSSSGDGAVGRSPGTASKRTTRVSKVSPIERSVKAAEAAAVRKQRDEERRKIMEQRRKELKQKQQEQQTPSTKDETVEIFGAQPS